MTTRNYAIIDLIGVCCETVSSLLLRTTVRAEHVAEALTTASAGPVAEGSVGAGTGTICYGFKSGVGTASRIVVGDRRYTVGVLVQANCGSRHQLTIGGVAVGRELEFPPDPRSRRLEETGSIIIVVATDAPLLPHQTKRLARRAAMGLARTGSSAGNGSGDLFIAFSTANTGSGGERQPVPVLMLPNDCLGPLFEATAEATEEAIVNSLFAAEAMTGRDGHSIPALPLEEVRAILARHGHK